LNPQNDLYNFYFFVDLLTAAGAGFHALNGTDCALKFFKNFFCIFAARQSFGAIKQAADRSDFALRQNVTDIVSEAHQLISTRIAHECIVARESARREKNQATQ
jgi:hypothetical protein